MSLTMAIVISLLSGLAGALIPVVVQPYFNHRKRLYNRTLRHVDSLVRLELRLLDIDAALHDNKQAFDIIVKGYKASQVSMQRLIPLELEDVFFQDLFSQKFKNDLYQFRYKVRRVNNDIDNFNHNYDLLTKAVLLDELDHGKIAAKFSGLLIDEKILMTAFEELQMECQRLLAHSKLRAQKDKVMLMRYRSWILQRRLKTVTDQEVEEAMQNYLRSIVNK
jgi:hypothetical protein